MRRRGKQFRRAAGRVEKGKTYPLSEGITLAKETFYGKFDGSVDLAVNLGVDPRHADQNIRGAVPLPNGTGKAVRIVVFAKGQKAVEASGENVDFVGGDDLAKKISEGWLDFDQVIATPDMMAVVGRLGRVLGPRGLMPNPKLGTVTFDLLKAIKELRAGRVEFRVDKAGIVHASVGRVGMDVQKLVENGEAVLDALLKAKPASAKGMYMKRIGVSSTMGPGIRVDTSPYK